MYQDLNQRLNLLIDSPQFVYRTYPDGFSEVLSLAEIPHDEHEYWTSAKITLRNGRVIDGVFVVREGGAEHVRVYFRVDGAWKTSDNKKVPELLGLSNDQIFPFKWVHNVPVENDVFHS